MAEMNMISVGYSIFVFTLDIIIRPSSRGSLRASNTFLEKFGSSSKNKIPPCARPISPIRELLEPL